MAGGAAQIHEASGGQEDDAVAIGEDVFVELRLDGEASDAGEGLQFGDLDFVVEVADVADDGGVAHPLHVLQGDDVAVAGGGHENVGHAHDFVEGLDFVAFHGGLQSANRIDFSDDHAGASPLLGILFL